MIMGVEHPHSCYYRFGFIKPKWLPFERQYRAWNDRIISILIGKFRDFVLRSEPIINIRKASILI